MSKGDAKLLNPAAMGTMTIWMNSLDTWDRFELWPWCVREVRKLIRDTDAVNVIHTLRIKTAISPGLEHPFNPEKMTLNLQAFDNMKFRLEKFEYEITYIGMYWTGRGLSKVDGEWIKEQCAKEVERMSKIYWGKMIYSA